MPKNKKNNDADFDESAERARLVEVARKMMYSTLGDHVDRELISAYLCAECNNVAVAFTAFAVKLQAVAKMDCMAGVLDRELIEGELLTSIENLLLHIEHQLECAVKGD